MNSNSKTRQNPKRKAASSSITSVEKIKKEDNLNIKMTPFNGFNVSGCKTSITPVNYIMNPASGNQVIITKSCNSSNTGADEVLDDDMMDDPDDLDDDVMSDHLNQNQHTLNGHHYDPERLKAFNVSIIIILL